MKWVAFVHGMWEVACDGIDTIHIFLCNQYYKPISLSLSSYLSLSSHARSSPMAEDGVTTVYRARVLVAADGAESAIARKLGVVISPPNASVTYALAMVLSDLLSATLLSFSSFRFCEVAVRG